MQKIKLYSVSEFSRLVGVDYQVIYQGIKKGHINRIIVLDKRSNKFKYKIPHSEFYKFDSHMVDNIIDSLLKLIENNKDKYNIIKVLEHD